MSGSLNPQRFSGSSSFVSHASRKPQRAKPLSPAIRSAAARAARACVEALEARQLLSSNGIFNASLLAPSKIAIGASPTAVTYTFTISNPAADVDLSDLVFNDALPANETFQSIQQVGGSSSTATFSTPAVGSSGRVSGEISSLPAKSSATFELVVDADGSSATKGDVLTNTIDFGNAAGSTDYNLTAAVESYWASPGVDVTPELLGPPVTDAGATDIIHLVMNDFGTTPPDSDTIQLSLPDGVSIAALPDLPNGNQYVGQTGTVTIPVTDAIYEYVDPAVPVGTLLTETATAVPSPADVEPSDNTATFSMYVRNPLIDADPLISLDTESSPATAGSTYSFTFDISNDGRDDAQDLSFSEALPAGVTFQSITQDSGPAFTLSTPAAPGQPGAVSGSIDHFSIYSTARFTEVVKYLPSLALNAWSDYQVRLSSIADSNTANDSISWGAGIITSADLAATELGPQNIVAGANNNPYTITVTNDGPSDAQNVSLSDAVPSGLTFSSITQTDGPAFTLSSPAVGAGGQVTGSIATLPAGGSATFQLVLGASVSDPVGSSITNTATVSSATSDLDTTNNSASASATVQAQPDLAVTMSDPVLYTAAVRNTNGTNLFPLSPAILAPGARAVYTINLVNNGPSNAQNVQLSDTLPSIEGYVSASFGPGVQGTVVASPPTGGTGTVIISIPAIPVGGSSIITLTAGVFPSAPVGTSATNSATAKSDGTDPVSTNNTALVSTPIVDAASPSIKMTAPTLIVGAGNGETPPVPQPVVVSQENATFTVDVENAGPDDAQNVVWSNVIPTGATLVSVTQLTGPTFTLNQPSGGVGTLTGSIATLPAGQGATFAVTYHLGDVAPGTTFTSTASVTSDTLDLKSSDNTSSATDQVFAPADLAVSMRTFPFARVGGDAIYNVSVDNLGAVNAPAATLELTIPANAPIDYILDSSVGRLAIPAGTTGTIDLPIPAGMVPGASRGWAIYESLPPSLPDQTQLTTTAQLTNTLPDDDPSNNSASATTTGLAVADVSAALKGPSTSNAGDSITYTLTVGSGGLADAQNVAFSDALPAGLSFVSATQTGGPAFAVNAPATGSNGTITGSINTLPTGSAATFKIVAQVNPGTPASTTIANTATITTSSNDGNTSNNSATATTNVNTSADVGIQLAGPAKIVAGANNTYTITVTNTGPSDAQGVSFADALPTGLTFSSLTQTAGPTFATTAPAPGSNGQMTGSIATLPAGASATFTLVAKAGTSLADGSTITNTATVNGATSDPNSANNSASAAVTVQRQPDLALTMSDPVLLRSNVGGPDTQYPVHPAILAPGARETYTLNLVNNGPSDAYFVRINDTLPADVQFMSASFNSGAQGTVSAPSSGGTGNVIFSLPSLPVGGAASVSVTVYVLPTAPLGTTETNTARASSDVFDANPADNTASVAATVKAAGDLSVSVTPPPYIIVDGGNGETPPVPQPVVVAQEDATFTFTVTNSSYSDAPNVVFTDPIPAGATLASVTQTSGPTFTFDPLPGGVGTLTGRIATFPLGPAATFAVTYHLGSAVPGSNFTVTGNVTSDMVELAPANNTASATDKVYGPADLALSMKTFPFARVGGDAIYSLSVDNLGQVPAPAGTVQVTLPDNVSVDYIFSSSGSGQVAVPHGTTGTFDLSIPKGMLPGASLSWSIYESLAPSIPDQTQLTTTAELINALPDDDPSNNSASATTTGLAVADVSASMKGPSNANAGDTITYTLTVGSSGAADAQNVAFSDVLPANLSLVSVTQTNGPAFTINAPVPGGSGGTITGNADALPTGKSATFQIVAILDPSTPAGSSVSNTATVSTTTPDSNASNNTATVTTNVTTAADMSIGGTGPDVIYAVGNATYEFTITNNGPSDAQNVKFADALPANLTFLSLVPISGNVPQLTSGTSPNVTATLGTIPAHSSATFDLIAGVNTAHAGFTMVNTATVASDASDPNAANNSVSISTPVPAADLRVSIAPVDSVTIAGEDASFIITVQNAGPNDAQDVVLRNPIPAGATLASTSEVSGPAFVNIGPTGGSNASVWLMPDLAAGQMAQFEVTYHLTGVAPGTTFTDTARATSDMIDPAISNNTASLSTPVLAPADLAVAMNSVPVAAAGRDAIYTVLVTNDGGVNAGGATLTFNIPANAPLDFVQGNRWFGTLPPLPHGATGPITFQLAPGLQPANYGQFDPGDTAVLVVYLQVPPSTPDGTVLMPSATLSHTAPDDDPSNNSVTVDTPVVAWSDATASLNGPATITPGQDATYNLSVFNNGPADAQGYNFADVLPASMTIVSFTQTGGTQPFTLTRSTDSSSGITTASGTAARLLAGASATFRIIAHAPATLTDGKPVTDTLTVAATNHDANPANNTATLTSNVVGQADLGVSFANADSFSAHDPATVTIHVTNSGPSDASNVVVTDVLPDGVQFISASQGQTPTTNQSGQQVVAFNLASLPAGASTDLQVTYQVPSDTPVDTPVVNSASVSASTLDPATQNNSTSTTGYVVRPADAFIMLRAPQTWTPGTVQTFILMAENFGDWPISNAEINYTLPDGVTFVHPNALPGTYTPLADGTGGTLTVKLPTLDRHDFILPMDESLPASTPNGKTLVSSAIISSDTYDADPSNNFVSTTTTAQSAADLSETASGPDAAVAGKDAVYHVTVTNKGPSDAQGVLLTDMLPDGLTFASITQDAGPNANLNPQPVGQGVALASISDLPAGASASFTVTAHVSPHVLDGTVLSNTINVASTAVDANPRNNTSTVATTVFANADVAIALRQISSAFVAGGSAAYSFTITNNGPSDAQNVSVSYVLPTGVSIQQPFPSEFSPTDFAWKLISVGGVNTLRGTMATMPAGASDTYSMTLNISPSFAEGAAVANTINVASTTPDANPANNSATVNDSVSYVADLAVTLENADVYTTVDTADIVVHVQNKGPSPSKNIVVQDVLPDGVTFVSASQGQTPVTNASGQQVLTFTLPSLDAGAAADFHVRYRIPSSDPLGATVTDSASVSADTTDPVLGNNKTQVDGSVVSLADAFVTLRAPSTWTPGTVQNFTINVWDFGPYPVVNPVVTYSIPDGVTFVNPSALPGTYVPLADGTGGTLTFPIATVFHTIGSPSFNEYLSPAVPNGTALKQTVSVTSDSQDADPSNNSTSATTTAQSAADLSVAVAGPATAGIGRNVLYHLTIANNGGPSDAQNVVLTDMLPSGTTFVSISQDSGPTANLTTPQVGHGDVVMGKIANLPAGSSATFSLTAQVPDTVSNGTTLTNFASVSSVASDSNTSNNAVATSTEALTSVNAAVIMSFPATWTPGTVAPFGVAAVNNGKNPISNVTLVYSLPDGATFADTSTLPGTYTPLADGTGGTLVLIIPSLASGQKTFFFREYLAPWGQSNTDLTYSASITSDGFETATWDNSYSQSIVAHPKAELWTTLTGPSTVIPGQEATYTLKVETRRGPSDAPDLLVYVSMLDQTTFVSATQGSGPHADLHTSQGKIGFVLTVQIPSLPVGASAAFTFTVLVDPNVTPGKEITTLAETSAASNWIIGPSATTGATVIRTSPPAPLKAPNPVTASEIEAESVPAAASVLPTTALPLSTSDALVAVAGKPFSGVVAQFTAPPEPASPVATGAFKAIINWGDDALSVGTVTYDAKTRQWEVAGSHTYRKHGLYHVTVLVTKNGREFTRIARIMKVTDPVVKSSLKPIVV